MKVFVYKDKGVSPFSLRQVIAGLKGALPEASVEVINAATLAKREWQEGTALLAIPGGRDIFYHRALKGEANAHIRTFVQNGGAYLGICAGAYYASKQVIFEKGRPLEVIGERELGFFPGSTVGALFEKVFSYHNEESVESARLTMGKGSFSAYYYGGCLFDEAHTAPDTEVLASYTDLPGQPAAIVRCRYGKGRALLSGVHLEHGYPALKRRSLPLDLLEAFKASETERHAIFCTLVRELVGAGGATLERPSQRG